MLEPVSYDDDKLKLLATIGHVCLSWSLLEHSILFIIATIEGIPEAKAEIIYGSTDWRPRLNVALNLARYEKLPQHFVQRLTAIRAKIDSDKIADRRNTVVHGAQRNSEAPGETVFHMARIGGGKKEQSMSALDVFALGTEINALVDEANAIFEELTDWKIARLADDGFEGTAG